MGGGWGVVGSHKAFLIQKFLYGQMTSIQAVFIHISQNVAKSMPSLTSQSCGDHLLTVCLFQAWWGHLYTTWALADVRLAEERALSKSRLLYFWLQYTCELLVYCCIHQVVVKSEHWNYVCNNAHFGNLVTYTYAHVHTYTQQICTHTHMHAHTRTHAHAHTHIRTRTHTHTSLGPRPASLIFRAIRWACCFVPSKLTL